MDDRYYEEKAEFLETEIPEELNEYLKADNDAVEVINKKIDSLEGELISLNEEREAKIKNFDDRLEEYKMKLAAEREEVLEELAKKEEEINTEKSKVSDIKYKQDSKKHDYVNRLKEISSEYNSKLSSIEEAIKACGDNSQLGNALEEEKNKKIEKLSESYEDRKKELDEVLVEIGEKKEEPIIEKKIELDTKDEEKDDYNIETDFNPDLINIPTYSEVEYDTEVVSHESGKDVVGDLLGSEDVMEGHVFPFLKSLA